MSGIANIKQPANHWLAECVIEFKKQLEQGLDPSFKMDVSGVVFEVRLVSIPGEFERNTVPFSGETND